MEMKYTVKLFSATLFVGVMLFAALPGRAETISFTNTPAGNAVAELNRRLGITIVFRGRVNASQPVTFSVDDPDTPVGRLEVVNSLSNALGLDFQKVFVVSKIDVGATVPEVKIDSNAPIIFPTEKMPAREAIQIVASVDDAFTQISGAVTGDVVFPSRQMRAADAAALIAKQTGTGWKAYYGLFLRGQGPQRLEGTVLDHTNGGQEITELPLKTYRNTISTPAPIVLSPSGAPLPSDAAGPAIASVPANNPYDSSSYDPSSYGFNPYAYSPYGNSGYSPYGYSPYGGYPLPNGAIYPGYNYTPGGSGPVGTGTGSAVTSVPSTNGGTVLPDFPYAGGVPGQLMVGGY